ncbi:MAG TPA: MauE/DoxX family redox-associated membrane protein [Actinomycetota bacterium]|nr:MauE/DoxX family redox-associated membrane protein [Actinomycetota bacterium]
MGTITPVVHGERRSKWAVAVALHALGAVVSAAALGAVLATAGMVAGAPWGPAGPVLLSAVAAVYAARELLGIQVPVPEARRQVPEWWRWTFPPFVASFLYGLGLGVGFLTHLRHGTLAAVAVAAGISGHPLAGAVIVGAFGLARALPLAFAGGGSADEGVATAGSRLDSLGASSLPRIANGLILVAVAVAGTTAVPTAPGRPVRLAAAALAVVFAWAATAKLVRPAVWREALSGYGLGRFTGLLAIGIPAGEASVVALLLGGAVREAGTLAAGLLVAFTLAAVRLRNTGPLPCGCFGSRRRIDVRLLVARNLALLLLAVAVAAWPVAPFPALLAFRPEDILPLALVGAGMTLAFIVARRLALLRAS